MKGRASHLCAVCTQGGERLCMLPEEGWWWWRWLLGQQHIACRPVGANARGVLRYTSKRWGPTKGGVTERATRSGLLGTLK
jgi:hypothetical protein